METIAILKKKYNNNKKNQNLISSWTFCDCDCYKQPIFFSPPCLFSVFNSTERTGHCFASGQQCLSPDLAQRYRWQAALQSLD